MDYPQLPSNKPRDLPFPATHANCCDYISHRTIADLQLLPTGIRQTGLQHFQPSGPERFYFRAEWSTVSNHLYGHFAYKNLNQFFIFPISLWHKIDPICGIHLSLQSCENPWSGCRDKNETRSFPGTHRELLIKK